jgi:type IV pilus assembly protein PilN
MIRINLLPARRNTASTQSVASKVWGYTYLGASLAWCVALAFVYFSLISDRDQALAQNAEVESQIAKVKAESGNLEQLQKQLEQSKQIEEVVKGLKSARQGPSRMLLELSAILSPSRGPTIDPVKLEELRKSNPEAGITAGWDTRRLWITGFEEHTRACRIVGEARNNEDIAEFLRRLALSAVFDDVVLVRTGQPTNASATVALVAFELTCKVRY